MLFCFEKNGMQCIRTCTHRHEPLLIWIIHNKNFMQCRARFFFFNYELLFYKRSELTKKEDNEFTESIKLYSPLVSDHVLIEYLNLWQTELQLSEKKYQILDLRHYIFIIRTSIKIFISSSKFYAHCRSQNLRLNVSFVFTMKRVKHHVRGKYHNYQKNNILIILMW